MSNILKWLKLGIRYPSYMLPYTLERLGVRRMDDRKYLKLLYMFRHGVWLDLDSPTTYTEKLNWLKLYDHNPKYAIMADKYAVKDYIADLIGGEYVIRLLGVYDCFDDIDFSKLPARYVLKSTHDSHGVIIVDENHNVNMGGQHSDSGIHAVSLKNAADRQKVKKFFDDRLAVNFYFAGREWGYKNVRPRIIAEEYIEGLANNNYKFFCFNGDVKMLYAAPWRESTVDYFDADYNHIDIITTLHQCAPTPPPKPASFEQMKRLAEKVSKGYPHMRVDFYDVNGKVYFGEITFYHEAGFEPFIPDKWNKIVGDYIELPV